MDVKSQVDFYLGHGDAICSGFYSLFCRAVKVSSYEGPVLSRDQK